MIENSNKWMLTIGILCFGLLEEGLIIELL